MKLRNVSWSDNPDTPAWGDGCGLALARLALVCALVWAWWR